MRKLTSIAFIVLAAFGNAQTIKKISFLGEQKFATGYSFGNTNLGGISGLTFNSQAGAYYGISDDRSQLNSARFYTFNIGLGRPDGKPGGKLFGDGSVRPVGVNKLYQPDASLFPPLGIDPEGIAFDGSSLWISSEGDANALLAPFIREFSLFGDHISELPIPSYYLPAATTGIRQNLAFESLTLSPGGFLFSATENALKQDGPQASVDVGSKARILKYNPASGALLAEYVYLTEKVVDAPIPAGSFATNGLVELLALSDTRFLALERSFSNSVGNAVKLFLIDTSTATNVKEVATLPNDGSVIAVKKELVLDLGKLGITLDNLEAMTWGPSLSNDEKILIIASDNNFSPTQFTQFLAFKIKLAKGKKD